jgi:hypothetical protein
MCYEAGHDKGLQLGGMELPSLNHASTGFQWALGGFNHVMCQITESLGLDKWASF